MIIKSFELEKKINKNIDFYLLYGPNEGLRNELIDKFLLPFFSKNIYRYFENDIIENNNKFEESIYNKSFFEDDKLIIIEQATDKIFTLIKKIIEKKIHNLKLIIKSSNLDKKSKLRNFFEKENSVVIIPFYNDNYQSLFQYVEKYLIKKKIKISNEQINFIINRSKNRINLKIQLEKISSYFEYKKIINHKDLLKIISTSEDHDINELVENCLLKNKNGILNDMNENSLNTENYIIILRTFLIKLKRLYRIQTKLESNYKNIDNIISTYKPPIFWKEKEIVKKQLVINSYLKINKLLKKVNEIELALKKNNASSNYIVSDFIISFAN